MATIKTVSGNKLTADGMTPILLRVSTSKGTSYVSTGIKVSPGDWDGTYTGSDQRTRFRLEDLETAASALLSRLRASGDLGRLSAAELANIVRVEILGRERRTDPRSLLTARMEAYMGRCAKPGTAEVYRRTLDTVRRFDRNADTLKLEDIDKRWLDRFERHCRQTMAVNTVSIHLRNIRTVFNDALSEGVTTHYPFRAFKIRQEATAKRSLTLGQLRRLRDMDLPEDQERYRDYFLLMLYLIGINTVDLFTARPSQLSGGRLEYRREKTGRLYSVKVEPEAMEIIERRRGKDFLLEPLDSHGDFLSWRTQLNKRLKALGQVTGKRGKVVADGPFPFLSTYWARHTWATIAYEAGVSVDTIAQALGHSDRAHSVTMIYIKPDQSKVDEANRRVIDLLKGDAPHGAPPGA